MASYVANPIPVICRYSTHPWVSPCGPAFGCSKLILSNLSGLLRSTNSFLMNLSLHAQRKVTKRKGIPGARASHTRSLDEAQRNPGFLCNFQRPRIPLRCIRATGVVLTRIPARQDSIDRPWSIDPISEAVFGELDGRDTFPVKFAEAFGFGRENPTWTSDLALSSPDGESRRPVGKVEW